MAGAHGPYNSDNNELGFAFVLMAGSTFSTVAHGWSSWPHMSSVSRLR